MAVLESQMTCKLEVHDQAVSEVQEMSNIQGVSFDVQK
jgi:hypothetical protein